MVEEISFQARSTLAFPAETLSPFGVEGRPTTWALTPAELVEPDRLVERNDSTFTSPGVRVKVYVVAVNETVPTTTPSTRAWTDEVGRAVEVGMVTGTVTVVSP